MLTMAKKIVVGRQKQIELPRRVAEISTFNCLCRGREVAHICVAQRTPSVGRSKAYLKVGLRVSHCPVKRSSRLGCHCLSLHYNRAVALGRKRAWEIRPRCISTF